MKSYLWSAYMIMQLRSRKCITYLCKLYHPGGCARGETRGNAYRKTRFVLLGAPLTADSGKIPLIYPIVARAP